MGLVARRAAELEAPAGEAIVPSLVKDAFTACTRKQSPANYRRNYRNQLKTERQL